MFNSKCIDAHATKYFFRNNKLLRNLEKEEDKGKEDFLHKYHIIMKYKIAQGWVWQKKWKLKNYIDLSKR